MLTSKISKDNKGIKREYKGLQVTTTFINYSKYHLVICFRDGCYSVLSPSDKDPYQDILMVGHQKSNLKDGILTVDGVEDERLMHIKEKLKVNHRHVEWEESIDISSLVDTRGGKYIYDLDIYIGIVDNLDFEHFHPFSFQHITNRELNPGVEFDPKTQISFTIKIVDNELPGVDYYTVINDDIVHLKSELSSFRNSGLYVIGVPELDTVKTNKMRKTDKYSIPQALEGVSKFKLFKSVADATIYLNERGTLASVSKLELSRQETKNLEMKKALEQLQHENALINANRSKTENELKSYQEEYERDLQNRKQDFELRIQKLKEEAAIETQVNKSNVETLKVIGGGLALGVLLLKILL